MFNFNNEHFVRHETFWSSVVIATLILVFNWEAIFGLDILLLDDNARYASAVQGNFLQDFFVNLGWGLAFFKALNMKLMLIGVNFTRFFLVAVYAIPLSITLYYFNRKLLGLGFVPSFVSAIFINILPFQYHIPKFIDGSYPVTGLLFLFLSITSAVFYLNSQKYFMLIWVALFYYLTTQTFAELSIVVFPALFILFFLWDGYLINKIVLFCIYLLFIGNQVYHILILNPQRVAAEPVLHNAGIVVHRLEKYIQWGWAIDIKNDIAVTLVAIAIITIIIIGYFLSKSCDKNGRKNHVAVAYYFYTIFFLLSMAPFIFLSKYFSTRYFFTSYTALWILIILSVYYILKFVIKREAAVFLILFLIVIYSGCNRHYNQARENAGYNKCNNVIYDSISSLQEIKPDAQIVVTGKNNGTGEYYVWSSGYLKYCLKRSDIDGLVGNEYQFYNPFDTTHRGYAYKMEGLDLSRPLYVLQFRNGKPVEASYFLQWEDRKEISSSWVVYIKDSTSALLTELFAGKGLDEYKDELSDRKILPEQVVWGNYKAKGALNNFY